VNEIAKVPQTIAMPPAASPTLTRALDVALSGAVTTACETLLLPGKELAPEARRMGEVRLSILSRSLDARSRTELTTILGRMFAGYPSARQSGDDARTLLIAYLSMVDEFPPWAVSEACRRRAAAAFPPSASELREGCSQVVSRYQQERQKLRQALTAKTQPAPPGERERVSAGMDALRSEVAARAGEKRRDTAAEARAALEKRCADLGIDPAAIDAVPDIKSSARSIGALARDLTGSVN
jgi:hypothetical protein